MGNQFVRGSAATVIALVLHLVQGADARAAEIKVLALESQKASLEGLVPQFERTTGHKVLVSYGDSSTLPTRVAAGEVFDVALASALVIDRLIKDGKLNASTRTDVSRVAIGMGVRKGAPKPDISTIDTFKQALLNAKSVSFPSAGPSGVHLQNVLKRLDIASDMQPKLRPVPGGPAVMGPVARGEVELGIITIPFIVLESGADLVGPLPAELQQYVVYAAGIGVMANDAHVAGTLIRYVTSPEAASVFRSQGLDPITIR